MPDHTGLLSPLILSKLTEVRKSHHSDSIVEQWFTKHQDVQQFIDVDLLKDREHSDRIHSWDDGAKQQARKKFQSVKDGQIGWLDLTHSVQQAPDEEGVPQGPHNSEHQDRAQVLHEGTNGQEVASIQDNRRQEAEEEQSGVQHWGYIFSSQFDEPPDQQAHRNQQAALWHDAGQPRNQVEPWENGWKKISRLKGMKGGTEWDSNLSENSLEDFLL